MTGPSADRCEEPIHYTNKPCRPALWALRDACAGLAITTTVLHLGLWVAGSGGDRPFFMRVFQEFGYYALGVSGPGVEAMWFVVLMNALLLFAAFVLNDLVRRKDALFSRSLDWTESAERRRATEVKP